MNKYIFAFLFLSAGLFFTGCSTKFNVAAPYKNITVVDAFLDQADTAHYIRIEKAFLDENKNAITMATVPDSSFYPNLNVRMDRIDFSGNLWDTIHLNRVDLTNEGYPKQTGVFFNAPNYAYKFKNALDPNYIYRLIVTNQQTGIVDSADAPVIVDNDPNIFYVGFFDDTILMNQGFNFASTLPNAGLDILCQYNTPSNNFSFENSPIPISVAQGIIAFNWNDSNVVTQKRNPTVNTALYNIGTVSVSQSNASASFGFSISDVDMYSAILATIGAAPANTARLLGRCTLYVYLGSQDFYTYQQITATQGVGLTGNEVEPTYTNIKGPNVLGLYTSRGMRSGPVTINTMTVDSLILSPILKPVNIQGTSY